MAPSFQSELNTIKQKNGEIRVINFATAKKDGYRLYICTPTPNKKVPKGEEPKPEIRIKANKRLDNFSIKEEIKKKNSAFCCAIILNIINQVILATIPIHKQGHTVFINNLWNGLNNNDKTKIISAIYEKKPNFLLKKAIIYRKIITGENTSEFFDLVCQNHPFLLPNTVEPQHASHIIYISPKDLNSKEGIESINLYVNKYPNKCCVVTKHRALLQTLHHHNGENQTITLTIFAHNNTDTKSGFLDWTIETAANKLGVILNNYPCIGHLDMFTCHSGQVNNDSLRNAIVYEKSKGLQDLTRSLSIFPTQENPFTKDTLAHQIHRIVFPCINANQRPPLAMTFSPVFIFPEENQFVGTSGEYGYSFSGTNKLLHYKKITTFLGDEFLFKGVCLNKAVHHKNNWRRIILKDDEIVTLQSSLLFHGFFEKVMPEEYEFDLIASQQKEIISVDFSL